ncbi:WD repeat- and FYVE domain-containing protein 4-like isoform X2 [Lemur catta]|uniref:WD repeat- and FYVE domain-containing protein 4-like isoform X2 n=1 Tax=Lemur catta TaxID=9447 RepID=UPI001E267AEC|nr:WD repeat- and FYVE domain-containing protein 4-like isoform X2 [Lemur catta]
MASGTLHLRRDLKESLRASQEPVVDTRKEEASSDPQGDCKQWPDLEERSKEELFLHLGPDWFLLLLQGHLHPGTTVLALKLLLHFLANPSLRGRFKDGLSAGSWLECSTKGVDVVMDNLKSHPPLPEQSPCRLPGFRVLSDFLAHHVHIPEVYLIVSTFFLQTPLTEPMDSPKLGNAVVARPPERN